MIQLIQLPYSPFCLVQRRILEFSGRPFQTVDIPTGDRSLVWRLTRQRYYAVPVLKDGRAVVFETDDDSQVIAKYLEGRFALGLFPAEWDGVQDLLWRYIEHEVEGATFRLNDIYYRETLRKADWLPFVRHKERKFGRGCLDQWAAHQAEWLAQLVQALVPCEQMLLHRPFLLSERPLFVDFDLYGMLANFLYSGHYELPTVHTRLCDWYARMTKTSLTSLA